MMLYVSFPVGIFHYFNQTENIEDWLIDQKKKYFPPISKTEHREFVQFIDKFNDKRQVEQLKKMEEQYRQRNVKQVA